MITNISNQELNSRLKNLVANERKILKTILEHINEVEFRKLYLEMAYSSLYEYLVQECHYSGSAAMRRISAARLLREIPIMAEQIQTGSLNLSQISEMSRAIKEKEKSGVVVTTFQKAEMVVAISGKTTLETQKEIAQSLDLDLKAPEKTFVQKDESVHLQLTLSREQYERLLACRDQASHLLLSESQDTSLAAVIDFLAAHYLGPKSKTVVTKKASSYDATSAIAINKTLTPKTRLTVLKRDRCCQYRDPHSGKTCGSTFNLEVDHKQPRWADGNHAISNLQVLCKAHNNYKYLRETNLRLL